MAHEFLSDDWFDAVAALGPPPDEPGPFDGPVNLVVSHRDRAIEIHVGGGTIGRGLLIGSPTTVTTTGDVIEALFVDGDQHAAMQAFMAGEVHVEGDMGALMAMGTVAPSAGHRAYARSIRALTAGASDGTGPADADPGRCHSPI